MTTALIVLAIALVLVGMIAALAWAQAAWGFWFCEFTGISHGIVEIAFALLSVLFKALE
jgi:hypothetical protein